MKGFEKEIFGFIDFYFVTSHINSVALQRKTVGKERGFSKSYPFNLIFQVMQSRLNTPSTINNLMILYLFCSFHSIDCGNHQKKSNTQIISSISFFIYYNQKFPFFLVSYIFVFAFSLFIFESPNSMASISTKKSTKMNVMMMKYIA